MTRRERFQPNLSHCDRNRTDWWECPNLNLREDDIMLDGREAGREYRWQTASERESRQRSATAPCTSATNAPTPAATKSRLANARIKVSGWALALAAGKPVFSARLIWCESWKPRRADNCCSPKLGHHRLVRNLASLTYSWPLTGASSGESNGQLAERGPEQTPRRNSPSTAPAAQTHRRRRKI
jgi:hypothetical protein